MSLASPSSSDFNASECLQKRKTEAVFGYLSNYVWFHQEGRLNETGECGDQRIHAVLFCVQSEGPPAGSLFFTAAVESEYSANVHLVAKTQSSPHWGQRNFTLTYGSIWGGSAFHMFTIPDEADIDLWRLRIQPHVLEDLNGKEFPTSDVYLMPESSECVSDVLTNGGCFDFTQVQTCVKSVPVSFRAPEKTASSKVAMHQSFQSQATLTLSRGSLPFLQPGRWILFVMCRHDRDCPATLLSVESYPEYRLRWKLIWGTLLAVLGMFLILFSVNTLYWLAYFILNKCSPETEENAGTTNRLWPVIIGVCGRDHVSMMRDKAMKVAQPLPFFPALLSLMVGVFLATAAQFVITHYGLMIRSGNRDICFYNDQCYYPGMVWDIPWNHAISNLGYFVAGAHVILQAFYAETRCRTFSRRAMSALFRSMDAAEHGCIRFSHWQHFFSEADRNRSGRVSRAEWKYQYKNPIAFDWIDANGDGCLEKSEWDAAFRRLDTQSEGVVRECDFVKQAKEIDLRAFYAIGVSFAAEGVGSMCYHLCPSVETFQFDTCFMIPIANLLTLALLDWDHSGHDEITALKYFVYILTPVWLVNFIGTWYDIGVFPIGWIYWIYAALVILWATVVLLAGMRRIVQSPGRAGHITKRALQVLLVICIAVAFLFPNVRVVYFSGTANLFLELSVVVMIVVIGRQLYLEDFRYVTCQMRHIGARVALLVFDVFE
ncbi:unnamed protein product [Effrenium voratum]|nr:unnamed protein product [Effrenium voratum]